MKLLMIGSVVTEEGGRLLVSDKVGVFVDEIAPHWERVTLCGPGARRDDGTFYQDGRSIYDYGVKGNNVRVIRTAPTELGQGLLRKSAATLTRLFPYVRLVAHADFVYIWMPSFSGILAQVTCRLLRRPYGLYFAGDWDETAPFVARWNGPARLFYGVYVRAARRAERIAVRRSRFTLVHGRALRDKFARVHTRVIEAAPRVSIGPADFRRREDTCQGAVITLLSVGSIIPRKGVHRLVEALGILAARGCQARLRLVGSGDHEYEATIRARVRELGLDDRVELVGFVRDVATLLDHYRRADIFVIATLAEGFPRVIYEAMAQGLPVVATDIGTITAMLRDRQDALLAPRGSSEALADAVELVLRDVELRRTLIRNGHDFAWRRLDVERPSTQLQRLISEHLDSGTTVRSPRRLESARRRP